MVSKLENKYILNNVLETLKNMVVNYSFALNEASSEYLYKEYKKQFDQLSIDTKELFNYAYEQGWYTLEEAKSDKIKQEIKKLQQELNK